MPPKLVNIHQAKTTFSKLIHRVQKGEEIVIGKAGKPVARLVPLAPPAVARQPGSAKGQIEFASDFEAPLPEDVLKEFEGG
ncbi:MAG: type II toxin-antitoxin system Phd/YefM family antitoxin [Tepidisphaeraceae bacterium]